VLVVFASLGSRTPQAFIEDREKLSGRRFDIEAMKAAAPHARSQWRAQAAALEAALSEEGFIGGAAPSMADVAGYMNVWWLSAAAPAEADLLLGGFDRLLAWRRAMAAFGHGRRSEISTAEALEQARAVDPEAVAPHDPLDASGFQPGQAVVLAADDYGRDAIAGRLVSAGPDKVVLERRDPRLGRLHVHAPRIGYELRSDGG
jgi:hypothetical protein